MAMMSGGGGEKGVAPAMNVTPLVDVVLVLLIIFMVVTPLLTKQFWLNLPKKDETAEPNPPPDEDKPVVITVARSGEVKINQGEVPRAELGKRLSRIFAARRDHVLYFDAADDAPYGITVEVMDVARRAGARSIAVLTERPKG